MGLPTSPVKNNSEKFIKSLKIKRTTSAFLKRVEKVEEPCSICHIDFDVNQKICILECGHMFHESCIVEWVREKNTCPLCRRKLYEYDSNVARWSHPRMSVRRSMENFRFSVAGLGRGSHNF
ncbi:hypothetical protein POM88_048704 [Heracleum sosnowskyi]|uniref:RING-type domain-containing protein n=1 Tax=Heracleum sosnowskyi TaxID=360622 RepID=A0AAD8GVQ9_9APIA|nr:hypothetical protein POM88_048704 [Heracleum sosnowskyi]